MMIKPINDQQTYNRSLKRIEELFGVLSRVHLVVMNWMC